MSLFIFPQPCLSSVSVDPVAAEVRVEKQEEQLEQETEERKEEEEEEEETHMEEQERVNALLQRKKLLQELGVVDKIQQLLQGRADGGGVLQEAKDACTQQQSHQPHHRQQQVKVRPK